MVGLVPNILGATITTFAFALLALVLRMVALYLTRRPPSYDDYLCIFAFVSKFYTLKTNQYSRLPKIFASGYCTTILICTTPFPLYSAYDL
jgi:hypothetical protein